MPALTPKPPAAPMNEPSAASATSNSVAAITVAWRVADKPMLNIKPPISPDIKPPSVPPTVCWTISALPRRKRTHIKPPMTSRLTANGRCASFTSRLS